MRVVRHDAFVGCRRFFETPQVEQVFTALEERLGDDPAPRKTFDKQAEPFSRRREVRLLQMGVGQQVAGVLDVRIVREFVDEIPQQGDHLPGIAQGKGGHRLAEEQIGPQ